MLDTIRRFDPLKRRVWHWSIYIFRVLVSTVSRIANRQPQLITDEVIKTSMDLVLKTGQYHIIKREREIDLEIGFAQSLEKLLTGLESYHRVGTEHNTKCMDRLRAQQLRLRRGHLLLAACKNQEDGNYLTNVRSLLDAGANPHAFDRAGNAPLHIAAGLRDLN